ncbi:MAG: DUF2141 domain-containing protein [Ignavibacteriae bacterium]|jgi:uncharacterized protein (DUF2141 family)|nr:DUF2141 domain-containing protein [Ignavibacteriota bacterium]NOH00296.1 DUF2141 domain-containing protein [Ignavibacteriota bacterium]
MIKLLTGVLLFFSSSIFAQTNIDSIKIGQLKLTVVGIENDEGTIAVALSNSREDYESYETVYRSANIKIADNKAEHLFDELPFGEYAIKVYHDEDDDGEIDRNFLGIPSEDYGFSNNASASFGPADYDDAKFIFDQKFLEIEINVD